jgi:hypothetical protein
MSVKSSSLCPANIPVRIVHSDSLLSKQDTCLVTHHTGLVKCRLSIQDKDVAVPQMSVDFLVDSHRPSGQAMLDDGGVLALLRCEELIRQGCSLIWRQFVLERGGWSLSKNRESAEETD